MKSHVVLAKKANHSVKIVISLLNPVFKINSRKNTKNTILMGAKINPGTEYLLGMSEILYSAIPKKIIKKKLPKNDIAAPVLCKVFSVSEVNNPTIIVPITEMIADINASKINFSFPCFFCKNLVK